MTCSATTALSANPAASAGRRSARDIATYMVAMPAVKTLERGRAQGDPARERRERTCEPGWIVAGRAVARVVCGVCEAANDVISADQNHRRERAGRHGCAAPVLTPSRRSEASIHRWRRRRTAAACKRIRCVALASARSIPEPAALISPRITACAIWLGWRCSTSREDSADRVRVEAPQRRARSPSRRRLRSVAQQ